MPPHRIVLHAPAVLFAADPASDRRRSTSILIDLIADRSLSVWSAGYAGAPLDLLTTSEERLEREWSARNRWHHGIGDVLGVDATRYFPVRMRRSQAIRLTQLKKPLCIGYPWGAPDRSIAQLTLWDPDSSGDRWSTLRSRIVRLGPEPRAVPPPQGEGYNVVHFIFPERHLSDATIREVVDFLTDSGERTVQEQTSGDRRPLDETVPTYSFGGEPFSLAREPIVISTLASVSRSLTEERTTRRVVCSAADRAIEGSHIVPMSLSKKQLFANHSAQRQSEREPQGGGSGNLSMQEGEFCVRFLGGRLAGLAPARSDGSVEDRLYRAQGVAQTVSSDRRPRIPTTNYLETISSAWFTGNESRGVHEIAQIDGVVTVESEAIMLDDRSVLLFGQTFRVPKGAPPSLVWAIPYEIPIRPLVPEKDLSMTVHAGTDTFSTSFAPRFVGDTPMQGVEFVVYGNAVQIPLPTGELLIRSGTVSSEVSIPFRFAYVQKGEGAMIVFRTTIPLYPRHWPEYRCWSVSYLFSGPEGVGEIGDDILGELPGFYVT